MQWIMIRTPAPPSGKASVLVCSTTATHTKATHTIVRACLRPGCATPGAHGVLTDLWEGTQGDGSLLNACVEMLNCVQGMTCYRGSLPV